MKKGLKYVQNNKKTLQQRHWRHSSVFIVNFDISHFSSVSIVDFEPVITSWVDSMLLT